MNAYRGSERGSIGTFVVVGVVLTLIALAALYGLGKFGHGNDVAAPLVYEQSKDQKQDDKKQDKGTTNDTSADDAKRDTSSTSTDKKSGTTDRTAPAGKEQSPGVSTDSPSSADQSGAVHQPKHDDALPETGPADVIAAGVALGILTSVAVVYRRSQSIL